MFLDRLVRFLCVVAWVLGVTQYHMLVMTLTTSWSSCISMKKCDELVIIGGLVRVQ